MNSAISKNSEAKLISAKRHSDPAAHLIYQMFLAKSAYDLAVLVLAYQTLTGTKVDLPSPPPMFKRALGLIQELDTVPAEIVAPYITRNVDGAPSTQVTTDWGAILPPSDLARKQAQEARVEKGVYHGIRYVPKANRDGHKASAVTNLMLSVQR